MIQVSLHESFHPSRIPSGPNLLAPELIPLPGFKPGTDPIKEGEVAHLENHLEVLLRKQAQGLELGFGIQVELGQRQMGQPQIRGVKPKTVASQTTDRIPQGPVHFRKLGTADDGRVDHGAGPQEKPEAEAAQLKGRRAITVVFQNALKPWVLDPLATQEGHMGKGDFPYTTEPQLGFQQIPARPDLPGCGFVEHKRQGGHG